MKTMEDKAKIEFVKLKDELYFSKEFKTWRYGFEYKGSYYAPLSDVKGE